MIDHDAKPGHLDHCQICGSNDLRLIIDLGHMPLCDALLTAEQLHKPEVTYPLRLMQCAQCSLAQLDYVVPSREMYPFSYPYRAGISWPVVAAHKEMAAKIVERFGVGLAVDIGCNDGTLLAQFAAQGCPIRGVEPTDISTLAPREARVIQGFFDERTARELHEQSGQAHIVTFTNVFAHMADLGETMRGVAALLAKDGVLVIENHYLLDILERNQFDSIYHEHVRTYTLKSLVTLFRQYDMEVFDVERVPRYGGNIRVYIAWKGERPIARSVGSLLEEEAARRLYEGSWAAFRGRVYQARDEFMEFVRRHPVVGCSAPGRASTLLNFFGVTPEMMAWTGELAGSMKIGMFLPGCHIPVESNKRIVHEQPEYVVLLAWHYAAQISDRLRKEGVLSRLIAPLPTFSQSDSWHRRGAA
jgi:SAM-dependent methyltransferase